MTRTLLAIIVVSAIGIGGHSVASQGGKAKGHGTVAILSERDVIETLNGKDARVTTIEVTLGPGEAGTPHRHAGPIFGYILEGEFELGLDDLPVKTLKTGETFYEPGGILHRVSRNPSQSNKTRVLAVMVHPKDATKLTIPEPAPKGE